MFQGGSGKLVGAPTVLNIGVAGRGVNIGVAVIRGLTSRSAGADECLRVQQGIIP